MKPAMESGERCALLFILTPPRSYSTITTAILAGHPLIYGLPETRLFNAATVGELLDEASGRSPLPPIVFDLRLSGLLRTVAELREGDQGSAAIERARQWLGGRADWPTVTLMEHLRELMPAGIGLEKSPDTVSADDRIARCVRSWLPPDARYLHLTRHPVPSQQSMRRRWQRTLRGDDGPLIAKAASVWYDGHLRVMRALDRLPAGAWMRVRSEDLLREPYVWLPKILQWLGVECDGPTIDRMLRTEQWRFAHTGEDGKLFGGDPDFMVSPALRDIPDPGPVSFEPSAALSADMCARMTKLAAELGYQ
ncbi:MAG: sulfotransferase [Streptosporangiaceae bacterium]|nr:sulfotransferase [Streptosporangiaceae bacterium]